MRKVEFLDTSLRDGEQTQELISLSKKRLPLLNNWKKWGISAIEAGFPATSPDSFTAVQEIARS